LGNRSAIEGFVEKSLNKKGFVEKSLNKKTKFNRRKFTKKTRKYRK
jgi:hypothetical protein